MPAVPRLSEGLHLSALRDSSTRPPPSHVYPQSGPLRPSNSVGSDLDDADAPSIQSLHLGLNARVAPSPRAASPAAATGLASPSGFGLSQQQHPLLSPPAKQQQQQGRARSESHARDKRFLSAHRGLLLCAAVFVGLAALFLCLSPATLDALLARANAPSQTSSAQPVTPATPQHAVNVRLATTDADDPAPSDSSSDETSSSSLTPSEPPETLDEQEEEEEEEEPADAEGESTKDASAHAPVDEAQKPVADVSTPPKENESQAPLLEETPAPAEQTQNKETHPAAPEVKGADAPPVAQDPATPVEPEQSRTPEPAAQQTPVQEGTQADEAQAPVKSTPAKQLEGAASKEPVAAAPATDADTAAAAAAAAVAAAAASTKADSSSPAVAASSPLPPSDLDTSALSCSLDPSAPRPACDWTWGPPHSRSSNSEEHPREDVTDKGEWERPHKFYTFQAGVHVTPQGTGVLVRIMQRDQCCTPTPDQPLPLAYFRVRAFGTAQAAANPPLALGGSFSDATQTGRGHQAHVEGLKPWSEGVDLTSIQGSVEEQRVLQTFLPLPDAGAYSIQVLLTHFNVSQSMTTENYPMNSKLYEQRPGHWVDMPLTNARGEEATRVEVPEVPELKVDRSTLPLCGTESPLQPSGPDSSFGAFDPFPLAGRWVFAPSTKPSAVVSRADPPSGPYVPGETDLSTLDRKWLVEHSVWEPFHCRMDRDVSFARALEKVQWAHFTGDSNTRHMFFFVCEMANGTALSAPLERIPRFLDPPHLCVGPSADDNAMDSHSGLEPGSRSRWVATYTNWFWGKGQTMDQRGLPGYREGIFNFKEQCEKFVEQNQTGVFYGWPSCSVVPPFIQALDGPGATYFGWGSHAAEMGLSAETAKYFRGEGAFGLPHFRHHPTLFPLTTANIPSQIPLKFGRQQRMRNNERVFGTNVQMREAVTEMRQKLPYASRTPNGGVRSVKDWVPLFDLFSPTHAAFEALAVDAVHFDKFFSYEEPRWLMHYFMHTNNFGPSARAQGRRWR